MTTLNDVKAFFAENTENTDVQDYIKTFVSDDRMLELALNSENGKQFFNKEFDRKISESRKKMEIGSGYTIEPLSPIKKMV